MTSHTLAVALLILAIVLGIIETIRSEGYSLLGAAIAALSAAFLVRIW